MIGELEQRITQVTAEAEPYKTILTMEQADEAGKALKILTAMEKEVLSTFKPIIDKQKEAMNQTKTKQDNFLNPIRAKITAIKNALAEYMKDIEARNRQIQQQVAETLANDPLNIDNAIALSDSMQPAKIDGASLRNTWAADVVDFIALVDAASKNHSLIKYLIPNTTELNAIARALKEELSIPGVVAVKNTTVIRK